MGMIFKLTSPKSTLTSPNRVKFKSMKLVQRNNKGKVNATSAKHQTSKKLIA